MSFYFISDIYCKKVWTLLDNTNAGRERICTLKFCPEHVAGCPSTLERIDCIPLWRSALHSEELRGFSWQELGAFYWFQCPFKPIWLTPMCLKILFQGMVIILLISITRLWRVVDWFYVLGYSGKLVVIIRTWHI